MNATCHHKPARTVLRDLATSPKGLSSGEAGARLGKYGPNVLTRRPPRPLPLRFLDQLRDPMILVLLAAAGISLWASGGEDWMDTVIILIIVAVNAAVSLSQESSARKALAALQQMAAPQAKVYRDGQLRALDTSLLVPGDLILLEAGDLVPADARILEAAGLTADESALTGESVPVEKGPSDGVKEDAPLGDRSNMVLSSTVITRGRATCVVTATGMDTEVGRIASLLLDQKESETPLQKKMGEIGRVLSGVCLGVCAVMFGIGLLQGRNLLDMLLTAVSLAVAAIPEGLPAIVTIVLALGVQRLAARNAIVKTLPAVETLGCASVICSDKTGTLTQNKMTVTQVWTPGGRNRAAALTVAALCSDAALSPVKGDPNRAVGDPTEAALVSAAARDGLRKDELEAEMPREGEVPFDSGRKLMSTLHPLPGGGWRLMVKGAPDVLMRRCTRSLSTSPVPMTAEIRRRAALMNDAMAGQALRVLGTAYRDFDRKPGKLGPETEQELTFVGLIGMMDPPRPEVKSAVAACFKAGIRPVMITGDHKATAVAVARELGIYRPGDQAMTGEDLDFFSDELLEDSVEQVSVYARVSPEHKLRIVSAWQRRGKVVAMTGDGVNDAPALKAADIGCAMGKGGTDVAKGAADMILTDDNFSTIVSAVEGGRGVYANIRKSIHYLLSCNIGEILTIALATLLHFSHMPLLPAQLLWLNLVTDSLPALALGVEPVEAGVMEQPPRQGNEALFTPAFALELCWQGALVGLVTLAGYILGCRVLASGEAGAAVGNTMAFATLTLCQLFHAFDVRSDRRSLFDVGIFSNSAMVKAFFIGLALQLAVLLLPPLQTVFQVVSLNGVQWITVLALSVLPLFCCETVKWVRRRW